MTELVPAAILLGTYIVLAIGQPPLLRIDRTGAAVIGAILMVTVGGLPLDEAFRAVDYRTLILLFGMMVLIANLQLSQFFTSLARAVVSSIHHPAALLVAVVAASGALSALFVNDTICLVFTPVILEIAAARGHRPLPYLLALATASNIGSVATITGNPQNMLIGSLSGIGYRGVRRGARAGRGRRTGHRRRRALVAVQGRPARRAVGVRRQGAAAGAQGDDGEVPGRGGRRRLSPSWPGPTPRWWRPRPRPSCW